MLNLRKYGKNIEGNLKYIRDNKFKSWFIIFIIFCIAVTISFGSSYFSEKWKQFADIWTRASIEISQMLFNELWEDFILEFLVKNSFEEDILVNKLEINLAKQLPESWWGWPLDVNSKYNIVFNNSLIKIEKNNSILINDKIYVSYVRDYQTSLGSDLIFIFKAPFVIKKDTYTPFRITIPSKTIVDKIVFEWEDLKQSKSADVKEFYNNRKNIVTIKQVNDILSLTDLGWIYIKLYTDKERYRKIEWVRTFMSECWESWYSDCESTFISY